MTQARLLDLGLQPYREVWDLQHSLHERVRSGEEPETWIFVEHPPVVTLGRTAKRENVLLSADVLAARGVDLIEIERGGDVTYHGPGQLVVYPIRRLERFREVVPLVRALEGAVIDTCAHFGVTAERWTEHAGVWVGHDQVCAIGLAVQKMTSLHGIALNVSTELDYDRLINPCGLTDRGITSLSRASGRALTIADVMPALVGAIENVFGITLRRAQGGSIPHHDNSIPHHDNSIPHHDNSIPHHDNSIPHHDNLIAHHDNLIPHHDIDDIWPLKSA